MRQTSGDPYLLNTQIEFDMDRTSASTWLETVPVPRSSCQVGPGTAQLAAKCREEDFTFPDRMDIGFPNLLVGGGGCTNCVCRYPNFRSHYRVRTLFGDGLNLSGLDVDPQSTWPQFRCAPNTSDAFGNSSFASQNDLYLYEPGLKSIGCDNNGSLPVNDYPLHELRVTVGGNAFTVKLASLRSCTGQATWSTAYLKDNPFSGLAVVAPGSPNRYFHIGWSSDAGIIGPAWPLLGDTLTNLFAPWDAIAQSYFDHLSVKITANGAGVVTGEYLLSRVYGGHPPQASSCRVGGGGTGDLNDGGYYTAAPFVGEIMQEGVIESPVLPSLATPSVPLSVTSGTPSAGTGGPVGGPYPQRSVTATLTGLT